MDDRQRIEAAILAQEALRGVVPDEVVDVAITALRRELGDAHDPAQRRQITVLFADVSGFTAMSETMDAELVADRMNELWQRLDGEITRLGGRIDKHMGDAVMALWGSTTAHEDDVERAVRAGLAVQAAVEAYRSATGADMSLRVGINTGRAVVGAVGSTAELTAMGDTVNLASRLEHAAPVGTVLISADTYRHVRGVFDVEAMPPMDVAGKTAPVRSYVVLRAKPRAFRIPSRGIEGIETATIGRHDEIARLQAAYEKVAAGFGTRLVVVLGEAGVGKSRLLFELETWLELRPESVWLLQGRALPRSQTVPLGLLRDVISQRFGVLDSDEPDTVAAKIREGFDGVLVGDEADLVGRWLGFGTGAFHQADADGVASSARAHFVRWFEKLTTEEPAVLLLEDLHWADAESLSFVGELVERLPTAHLLVVGLARPDLLDRDRSLLEVSAPVDRVDVGALPLEVAAGLVKEVLRACDEIPPEFVDLVARRSDGNPFFAEEIVKMFIDHHVIRTDASDGRWHIDMSRVDSDDIPATLNGVLQARLDFLRPLERSALQCASVVGRIFWDHAVATIADDPECGRVALHAAARRELIYRRDVSAIVGCIEFIFKHALLRDVTYETVLLRDRRRLHSRAAMWLTVRAGDRIDEYVDTIAEHHRLAGESAAAAAFLERSGRDALDRGLTAAARRSYEGALALWSEADRDPPVLLLVGLGDACSRAGDVDAASAAVEVALDRAVLPEELVAALVVARRIAGDLGDVHRERAMIERAVTIADPDDGITRAKLLNSLADWELNHGDLDESERLAREALAVAEVENSLEQRSTATRYLGHLAASRGDLDAAVLHLALAADLARSGIDLTLQAIVRGDLGVALHIRGDKTGRTEDYVAAIEQYEQDLAVREQLGERRGLASTRANLAQALLRLGDTARARTLIHANFADAADMRLLSQLLLSLQVEADRRLTEGDLDGGLTILGAVASHPACTRTDREEVDRILSRTPLDASTIDSGMASGAALDFDTLVADVIANLSQ